jgi:hypothetical protein
VGKYAYLLGQGQDVEGVECVGDVGEGDD